MNRYLIQLMLTKGVGDAAIKRIMKYCASCPQDSLEAICGSPEKLFSILGNNKRVFNIVQSVQSNGANADKLMDELNAKGVSILTEDDSLYPNQLKRLLGDQCPPVLFVKGNARLLSTDSVGFCGSRKVSQKGISITAQCAQQLVSNKVTVVSGYAAGTDLAAHTSAMMNGGNTVFVLAEGILRYKERRDVRGFLNQSNHVFVSQFLPNIGWNVGNAMRRNSIIIGLSKAMILVESGRTGGTFAAGEESLRRGLPLFVIDYAKPEVSAEANPYFISRGGTPIRGRDGVPNLDKVFDAVRNGYNNNEQLMMNFD